MHNAHSLILGSTRQPTPILTGQVRDALPRFPASFPNTRVSPDYTASLELEMADEHVH